MKTNPQRRTIAQRVANRVFTHHGNYTADPDTGEVMLAVRPTFHTKVGRLGSGLLGATSAVMAGGLTYGAETTGRPSEVLAFGMITAAGIGMVALTGYDHLVEANGMLPDTVGPRVDDQARAAAIAE